MASDFVRSIDVRRALTPWVLALAALSMPAWAAEYQCKHNNSTSNIECKPRNSVPWVYGAEGFVGPFTGKVTFEDAEDEALASIPNGYHNYCYYDYRVNGPPWVVTLADPDYSKREDKDYHVTGFVYAGSSCETVSQQSIHIYRTRTNFCASSWWETYDGLGSLHCIRDNLQSPPPRCEGACSKGYPPTGGAVAWDPGWMGGGIFAHNGDKFQAEHDWSSGGFKPLVLARNYLSTSFPRLTRTPRRHFGLGEYWRTTFDRRMQTYSGTVTTKIAYRPDGSTRYFYQNGSAWTKRAEQSETLVNVVDGGGAVIGWRLSLNDNSFEDYDLQGRAIAIVDADGWQVEIAYGANDLISTVTDTLGRQLSFAYGSDGTEDWLVSVATPDGVIEYGIDA